MLTTLEDQLLNGLTKLQEEVGPLLKKIEQYLPGNGEHAVSEDVKTVQVSTVYDTDQRLEANSLRIVPRWTLLRVRSKSGHRAAV